MNVVSRYSNRKIPAWLGGLLFLAGFALWAFAPNFTLPYFTNKTSKTTKKLDSSLKHKRRVTSLPKSIEKKKARELLKNKKKDALKNPTLTNTTTATTKTQTNAVADLN